MATIKKHEATIRAWNFLAIEPALQQAALLDNQQRDRGSLIACQPLWGVPVGVKDIFATLDMPTTWGTPAYAGRYLTTEATVVSRLKAAGAIILGKTVTTELATAAAGPTRNPHHLEHTPGGSSSGSAAAVAAGMVPLAIGSQTMGSVLRPAAYCGIFGFKPSFGLISRQGMMPVSEVLDHVGFFARSLEDIEQALAVLTIPDRVADLAPASASTAPRLAWIKTPHWEHIDAVAQARLRQAVTVLQKAGVAVTSVELPTPCENYWETVQTLCAAGLYHHHGALLESHPQDCSPALQTWLKRGQAVTSQIYEAALRQGDRYRASITALFEQYDAILTPVTTGPAPQGLANTGSPILCALWTLGGVPAINLPLGKTEKGLPLGCQLVGPHNGDRQLLQIANVCWQSLAIALGDVEVANLNE